jgi:DNA repair protein RecN (Recombination protein N)
MLLELNITDFALIDNVRFSPAGGLNILTGETGAGKSIIIDAVNIVLGERADTEIVRTGAEKAVVEALFDCSQIDGIGQLLADMGIEADDGCLLVLNREIRSGRSISRVNGRTVPQSFVRELSRRLIDIHGQHQHQSLLDVSNHIEILDRFGGEDVLKQRAKVAELYHILQRLNKELEMLIQKEDQRQRDIDYYSYQVNEIDQAGLSIEEDDELLRKREMLANAEKIYQSLMQSYQMLYDGDDTLPAVVDRLGQIETLLGPIARFDQNIGEFYGTVNSSLLALKDISRGLRSYAETIEFDQQELNRVEERLDLINRLKRKYGNSIKEILDYRKQRSDELERLVNSEQQQRETRRQIEKIQGILDNECSQLSTLRQKAAARLEEGVIAQIHKLGMEKGIFKVYMEKAVSLSSKGTDDVEFMFTANLGQPLKPLSKIVSGGEMSRIMLAVKTCLAHTDSIPTLIFDEIDVGISGRTAQAVAQQLAEVSQRHQVVCVTHLPQIASIADNHYLIEKQEKDGHTYTRLRVLDDDARIIELARLLGGAKVTELTIEHAREMISMAKRTKKEILAGNRSEPDNRD